MSLDELIPFDELMQYLGYGDERSVRKWCESHQVPIVKLGLKKYILSHYLTQSIDNQIVIFVKGNPANQSGESNVKTNQLSDTTKCGTNKSKKAGAAFNPNDAIISKYLTKYESDNKSKAPKKRQT